MRINLINRKQLTNEINSPLLKKTNKCSEIFSEIKDKKKFNLKNNSPNFLINKKHSLSYTKYNFNNLILKENMLKKKIKKLEEEKNNLEKNLNLTENKLKNLKVTQKKEVSKILSIVTNYIMKHNVNIDNLLVKYNKKIWNINKSFSPLKIIKNNKKDIIYKNNSDKLWFDNNLKSRDRCLKILEDFK